ncbi:MAG: DUF805 domain-containing protein [Alphaproteobacteria bacterium]|jgi:uncharacterized membrane protein YhaH (DUF805 family)
MIYALSAFLPLVILGLALWATVRILHKTGRSGWWILLTFIPFINIIAYWGLAFVHWPKIDDANKPDVNAF